MAGGRGIPSLRGAPSVRQCLRAGVFPQGSSQGLHVLLSPLPSLPTQCPWVVPLWQISLQCCYSFARLRAPTSTLQRHEPLFRADICRQSPVGRALSAMVPEVWQIPLAHPSIVRNEAGSHQAQEEEAPGLEPCSLRSGLGPSPSVFLPVSIYTAWLCPGVIYHPPANR